MQIVKPNIKHKFKDLWDGYKLRSGAGNSIDKQLCIMETVSWIAGEIDEDDGHVTDHPECVNENITDFFIQINDDGRITDEERNKLREVAPHLLNSKSQKIETKFFNAVIRLIMKDRSIPDLCNVIGIPIEEDTTRTEVKEELKMMGTEVGRAYMEAFDYKVDPLVKMTQETLPKAEIVQVETEYEGKLVYSVDDRIRMLIDAWCEAHPGECAEEPRWQ